MSAAVLVRCDGAWDGGRFPCRGMLPIDARLVARAADPDALDLHAAHILAWEAGWAVPHPDAGGPTLCPAHRRQRDTEHQRALLARQLVSPEVAAQLRALGERWRTVLDEVRAEAREQRRG